MKALSSILSIVSGKYMLSIEQVFPIALLPIPVIFVVSIIFKN